MPVLSSPLLSGTAYQEQIAIETEGVQAGVRRLCDQHTNRRHAGAGATTAGANDLVSLWTGLMREQVVLMKRTARGEIDRAASAGLCGASTGIAHWGQACQMLPATDTALIAVHTIVNEALRVRQPKDPLADPVIGTTRTGLCGAIGRNVLAECERRWLRKHDRLDYGEVQRILADKVRRRKLHVGPAHRAVAAITGDRLIDQASRRAVCAHLGAQLFWRWTNISDLPIEDGGFAPAFETWRESRRGHPGPVRVRLSDAALAYIEQRTEAVAVYKPVRRLMVVPPLVWADQDEQVLVGGYVRIKAQLIKNATIEQLEAAAASDLTGVRAGLDGLNQPPWRLNRRVFEVQEWLYEDGGGFDRIPLAKDPPLPPEAGDEAEPDEVRAAKRARAQAYAANASRLGERRLFEAMRAEAHSIADRPAVWIPHSIDHRARSYPEPSYLNFQRDKLCRGLLEFAEPTPMADRGERWVKIAVANAFGHDKDHFDDRVKWADRNMKRLVDMAKDPREHRGWMEADKPFQALAACFALIDPEAAMRLPVEQDGTCNGLQHYAAIACDEDDAALVNLTAGRDRADVYEVVARRLSALVESRLDHGPIMVKQARWFGKDREEWEVDIRPDLRMALPYIGRPVVKQPVMTTTYKATLNGFVNQLGASLPAAGLDTPRTRRIRFWLAQRIQESIDELLNSATRFGDWFVDLCRAQTALGENFRMTGPLGLTIVLPHRLNATRKIKTAVGDLVDTTRDLGGGRVDRVKQAQASAPGIIHHFDATHMHWTSARCHAAGLMFAANHDSYATAPGTSDELAWITREQFVRLHEPDLSEMLFADTRATIERNATRLFGEGDPRVAERVSAVPPPPERGGFDVREVLRSDMFFN